MLQSPPFWSARFAIVTTALLSTAACGDTPSDAALRDGTYSATTFRITRPGLSNADVRAAGGSLLLVITKDNRVTGALRIPASIAGTATDFVEQMDGTVEYSTELAKFNQTADTFVRDLVWQIGDRQLSVTNQTAGAAQFTIVLSRR